MSQNSLDFLLYSFKRLEEMRKSWKNSGHYERFKIEKSVEEYIKKINRIKGQYKKKLKKEYYYDEFKCDVVDNLF